MRRIAFGFIAGFTVLAAASTASAAPILGTMSRQVHAIDFSDPAGDLVVSSTSGIFNENAAAGNVAFASQNTDIQTSQFVGTGSASISFSFFDPWAAAFSSFSTTFSLTEDHNVTLSGVLGTDAELGAPSASIFLLSGSSILQQWTTSGLVSTVPITWNSVLEGGKTYMLNVGAEMGNDPNDAVPVAMGWANFSFDFVLTPTTSTPNTPGTVPEPATLALLGAGVVGIVARRRLL